MSEDAAPRSPQETQTDAARLETQQKFIYDLLSALDRRRASANTRCTVIFAISSATLGFFLTQLESGQPLYHEEKAWRLFFHIVISASLFTSCLIGLSIIAPISPRSWKDRLSKPPDPSLSWFYPIAEHGEELYLDMIERQDAESLLKETSSQVYKISSILKKRYDRLEWTCWLLYASLSMLGTYSIIILINALMA